VRPSCGRRCESSVSHIPPALDSDEEKDANAKVNAALKYDDSSHDDDEDDDYLKNGATIPIDGKVYIKKVSTKDKIQAQVKNVYSKTRTNTSKMLSLASERSQQAYYHSKQYCFAKQGSGTATGAGTCADVALDVDVD
jgi:hypothetical protein